MSDLGAFRAQGAYAKALCDTDENWHVVYQTENGNRTGNWKVWNEAGEEHQSFPKDCWLPKEIFTEVWLSGFPGEPQDR